MVNKWVPFASFEEYVIAANGLVSSSPQKFRNTTSADMLMKYLLVDPNQGRVHIRFGLRGGEQYVEAFVNPEVLHNTPIADAALDGAFPLWRLDNPIVIPPSQGLEVELEDTTAGLRIVNVAMIGRKLHKDGSEPKQPQPFFLSDRIEIAPSSFETANLQGDQARPVEVHAFSLKMEETGTADLMRGLLVRVAGGGMKDWSKERVPASMLFPHRNAVAVVHEFPGPGIRLKPTEGFQFELHDASGSGDTVRVAMLGYITDRRP